MFHAEVRVCRDKLPSDRPLSARTTAWLGNRGFPSRLGRERNNSLSSLNSAQQPWVGLSSFCVMNVFWRLWPRRFVFSQQICFLCSFSMLTCRREFLWEEMISPLDSSLKGLCLCQFFPCNSNFLFWTFSITYRSQGNNLITISSIWPSCPLHPASVTARPIPSRLHPAHQLLGRVIACLQIFQEISLADKETLKIYSLIAITYLKKRIIIIKYPTTVPITLIVLWLISRTCLNQDPNKVQNSNWLICLLSLLYSIGLPFPHLPLKKLVICLLELSIVWIVLTASPWCFYHVLLIMCIVFTLMVRSRRLVSFRNGFVDWLVDLQSHVMRDTEYFSQEAQPVSWSLFFCSVSNHWWPLPLLDAMTAKS